MAFEERESNSEKIRTNYGQLHHHQLGIINLSCTRNAANHRLNVHDTFTHPSQVDFNFTFMTLLQKELVSTSTLTTNTKRVKK